MRAIVFSLCVQMIVRKISHKATERFQSESNQRLETFGVNPLRSNIEVATSFTAVLHSMTFKHSRNN